MQDDFSLSPSQHTPFLRRLWIRRLAWAVGIGAFLFVVALLIIMIISVPYRQRVARTSDAFTIDDGASGGGAASERIPVLVTSDDPTLGPADAPITIVEFSDFECPFCKEAFPIIRSVLARFDGQIRYIYRDFPVISVHLQALDAAMAGECAHAQGKFWELHDRLFTYQGDFSPAALAAHARRAGLDGAAFDACMEDRRFLNEVRADFDDGRALGVRGTPTWFINGVRVEGVIPQDRFIAAIEALLYEGN